MQNQTIALIGYGYWGKILEQILGNLGYKLDIVLISNADYLNQSQCDVSSLYSDSDLRSLNESTFVIVATGPIFHHEVLKYLQYNHHFFEDCRIWLEKPFFISNSQFQSCLGQSKNIFVDYPYVAANSHALELLDMEASSYEISLFSSKSYRRPYPIIFDFAPHLFTLMGICNQDLELDKYLYSVVFCHGGNVSGSLECFNTSLGIKSSSGKSFIFNFGIDKKGGISSISTDNNSKKTFAKFRKLSNFPAEASKFHRMTDLFFKPVDQNLMRFLAPNALLTHSPFCSIDFHRRIYLLTVSALSMI